MFPIKFSVPRVEPWVELAKLATRLVNLVGLKEKEDNSVERATRRGHRIDEFIYLYKIYNTFLYLSTQPSQQEAGPWSGLKM